MRLLLGILCFVQNLRRFLMPVTQSEQEKGDSYILDGNADGGTTTGKISESAIAQKPSVKTASVQRYMSDSDVAPVAACQSEQKEGNISDGAITTENISEPAILIARKDAMVTYFDKRPYCLFCGESQTQIQRHWLSKHGQEREVMELVSLRDKTERVRHVTRLRNLGNHSHNQKVLKEGSGQFLVTYRPKRDTNVRDYVPCENCWAYVLKAELFRHRCKFQKKTRVRGRRAAEAELLLPPSKGTSAKVQKLLNGMIDGTVKLTAKADRLIVQYTAKLIDRKGMEKKAHIREKVRELARFLLEIRKQPELKSVTMEECIRPNLFRNCVVAVKSLAGFNEETSVYDKPSVALKLGHTLSKLTKLVKVNALELRDDDKIKDADYFHELCTLQWSDEVSCKARQVIQDRKRNKITMLPLSGDVEKLNTYLNGMSVEYCELLRTAEEQLTVEHHWRILAETTLVQVIMFNRRRQGEVSRMTLDDYERKTTANLSDDTATALSPMELSLAKLFVRVEIIGKRNRTVPVILTAKHQACIDLLNEHRDASGIRLDNRYLFAYSHSDNHLRGHAALKTASVQCGAQHPATLTSTNFRKHVATLSQVLNLKDNELDMLAQYMGHDIRIHRQYYRLPNDLLQTAKLAKIFLLLENGNLPHEKGKSLDEIMVNIDESTDGKCSKLFCCNGCVCMSGNLVTTKLAIVLYVILL